MEVTYQENSIHFNYIKKKPKVEERDKKSLIYNKKK